MATAGAVVDHQRRELLYVQRVVLEQRDERVEGAFGRDNGLAVKFAAIGKLAEGGAGVAPDRPRVGLQHSAQRRNPAQFPYQVFVLGRVRVGHVGVAEGEGKDVGKSPSPSYLKVATRRDEREKHMQKQIHTHK